MSPLFPTTKSLTIAFEQHATPIYEPIRTVQRYVETEDLPNLFGAIEMTKKDGFSEHVSLKITNTDFQLGFKSGLDTLLSHKRFKAASNLLTFVLQQTTERHPLLNLTPQENITSIIHGLIGTGQNVQCQALIFCAEESAMPRDFTERLICDTVNGYLNIISAGALINETPSNVRSIDPQIEENPRETKTVKELCRLLDFIATDEDFQKQELSKAVIQNIGSRLATSTPVQVKSILNVIQDTAPFQDIAKEFINECALRGAKNNKQFEAAAQVAGNDNPTIVTALRNALTPGS